MAYNNTFKIIPAKPTFGSNLESDDAGNYIQNKTAKAIFCNALNCPQTIKVKSQSELLILRQARYLGNLRCNKPYSNLSLNSNLFSTMNLEPICAINKLETNTCPDTKINPSFDFYKNYVIDPNGSLFGKSECGLNNYLNYREYNN